MTNIVNLIKKATSLGVYNEELKTEAELRKVISSEELRLNEGTKKSRMSNKLIGIDPDAKLRLYKKNKKVIFLTIEESLRPYNFKKLSANSQKAITQGTSATKMVSDALSIK